MRLRITEKSQVSTNLEYGKFKRSNNREHTFLTNCKNELLKYGHTFVFKKWQIEELQKSFNEKLIYEYIEEDELYYIKLGGAQG